nr:structural protein [Tolivirales sp.]
MPKTVVVTTTTKEQPQKQKRPRRRIRRTTKTPNITAVLNIPNNATAAPVAKQITHRTTKPNIRNRGQNVVVTHREYLQDIVRTSSTYAIDGVAINPGISASFPWLSQIAGRFESYTFNRLDYVYEPMVPTTQPGTVMMAIDFDAADSPPNSKQTHMSYQGAVRAAPWQPFRISALQHNRLKMVKERYVRTGQVPANTDIKTYDMGDLYIGTVGTGTPNVTLGELYVEYTVTFKTPQIATAPNLAVNRQTAQSGVITISNGIATQVATFLGEGATPALLLPNSPNGINGFLVNPQIRSFLLSIATTPVGFNWGTAASTIFRDVVTNGASLYSSAFDISNVLPKVGKPFKGIFSNSVTVGSNTTLFEQFIVYTTEAIAQTSQYFSNPDSGFPFLFRTRHNQSNWRMEYSIVPITTEIPDQQPSNWLGLETVTLPDDYLDFKWPTDAIVIPQRSNLRSKSTVYRDPVNDISYGIVLTPESDKDKLKVK